MIGCLFIVVLALYTITIVLCLSEVPIIVLALWGLIILAYLCVAAALLTDKR